MDAWHKNDSSIQESTSHAPLLSLVKWILCDGLGQRGKVEQRKTQKVLYYSMRYQFCSERVFALCGVRVPLPLIKCCLVPNILALKCMSSSSCFPRLQYTNVKIQGLQVLGKNPSHFLHQFISTVSRRSEQTCHQYQTCFVTLRAISSNMRIV